MRGRCKGEEDGGEGETEKGNRSRRIGRRERGEEMGVEEREKYPIYILRFTIVIDFSCVEN